LTSFSAVAIETVNVQDISNYQKLGYQLQYILDGSRKLTLETVADSNDENWTLSNKAELNFGLEQDPLWIRFHLKNNSSNKIQKNIILPHVGVDEIDLYLFRKDKEKEHFQSGFRRPFSIRKIQTTELIVPILFAEYEAVTIYIKAVSNGPLSVPIEIWDSNTFYKHQQNIGLISGIILGAMLIIFLYNIFVYIELRENSYLYLSFYIASLILIDVSFTSFGVQYLWKDNLWFEEKSFTIALGFLVMFASLFVKSVIDVGKYLNLALKLCIGMGAILIVLALVTPYGFSLRASVPIVIIAGSVAAWVVIDVLLNGKQVIKYLIIGWGSFLIGFLLLFLTALNAISNSFILLHGIEIGALIEVLFLSLALVEKVDQANQQRDEALSNLLQIQKQTNNQLETRVKDRTFELEKMMNKLKKANKQLKEISFIDGLTELFNRNYFDGVFEAQWKNSQRSKSSIALLFLDIDHFKRLNDIFGHQVGDECLKLISVTIRSQVVRETDVVARYGGEEFIVLLPHTNVEDAEKIAENIRKSVSRIKPDVADLVAMTISIGVAGMVPKSGGNSQDLIRLADLALYKAKKEGRNQVVVATEEMTKGLEALTK
jgi:diguanylate cyclase